MANIKQEHKLTAPNQSSDKLLTLLEILSVQPEPVRLQELAWQASMNTSTVLRFLMTLEKRGYVVQDGDTGRYSLTFKLCGIADNIKVHTDIRNICLPYMKLVSKKFVSFKKPMNPSKFFFMIELFTLKYEECFSIFWRNGEFLCGGG